MRKYLRKIAKLNMKKRGIYKPFRKVAVESYFSKHWREYV